MQTRVPASAATTPAIAARAYLLLTLTTLCWGANAVFGRLAVGQVSPLLLVSLRWLLVFAILLVVARRPLREEWPVLRPHLPRLAAMGALGFTVFNALYYLAAHTTTAVNMGIIQGSIPVWVLLGALLVDRAPVMPLQGVGVALSLVGVALVASGGDLARLGALSISRGDGLMVAACLLYAGYTVSLRRAPAIAQTTLLTVLAGAALLTSLPLALFEWLAGDSLWPTSRGWLLLVLIALLPSLLAQALFIKGVSMIGPGRAGLFINLVPIFASLLGVVILDESFAPFHALALALILCGIALSEYATPPS